ncbi:MAG: DUF2628 domain-containing protein [Xanthobacteraceae bacterium]|nr:DUF2628 domain-containing protein [Xanthobacteraceae bacterium]
MSVYTVHEPPLRVAEAAPDPDRFVFVRDGFYFWAFLLTPLWMLRHRLWLVLLIYVAVAAGVDEAMYLAGLGTAAIALAEFLISLLIGLEAATLRRFSLKRRGWRNVGVVSGEDVEDAERRFFDAWVRSAPGQRPAAAAPSAPPPRVTPSPDIIGLFPDPGANR